MIQRIQSIFLLLASGSAFGLFGLPFASSESAVPSTFFADSLYSIQDHIAMLIFFIAAGALSLASIFLFNNRPLQMTITRIAVVANLLGLVLAIVLFIQNSDALGTVAVDDGLGIYLPIGFLVFGILALRAIKQDDTLVQSMDRLR